MSHRARFFMFLSLGVAVGAGLKLRSDAFSAAARHAREFLRLRTDEPASDGSGTAVRFEWLVQTSDLPAFHGALNSQQIAFISREAANSAGRASMLRRKLTAVGMHFDQEPATSYEELPLIGISGAATADRLAVAIDRALESTASGLIVDTTSTMVEIDQQWDLGRAEIVLIEPHRSYQLRAGTRRVLLQALQEAAQRPQLLGFRPIPDLAQLRHELADLPSLDHLIAALQQANYDAYFSHERVTRLGTVRRCDQCGSPIVDVAALSDLLARFYGTPGRRQEIADALAQSGLEVGDAPSPRFCRIHGQTTSPDEHH